MTKSKTILPGLSFPLGFKLLQNDPMHSTVHQLLISGRKKSRLFILEERVVILVFSYLRSCFMEKEQVVCGLRNRMWRGEDNDLVHCRPMEGAYKLPPGYSRLMVRVSCSVEYACSHPSTAYVGAWQHGLLSHLLLNFARQVLSLWNLMGPAGLVRRWRERLQLILSLAAA